MTYRFDWLNFIVLTLLMFVVCLGAALAQGQSDDKSIPFYRPTLEITPKHRVVGDDVTFTLHGYLPGGNWALIAPEKPEYVLMDFENLTQVYLHFKSVEVSEMGTGALVETEGKVTVSGLASEPYEAVVTINGVEVERQLFTVLPEGTPEPMDPSLFNLQIAMDPVVPMPGDEVTFYISGEFPSAGYTVVDQRLDVMKSLPEQLAARIYVEEPSGLDAQVITPFRVIVGKAILSEGVHPLIGTINDEVFYKGAFDVGGKVKPEPEPILRDVKIVTEPENPAEGEEFTVFVEGVFPSPGYFIAEKSMYMTRSIPAHIVVNLKVLPLEGIMPHDDAPFKEEVGTAALPAGAHPLRGFMNDVLFYDTRLVVGETPKDEYPIYKFAITFSPSNPAPGEPFDAYASGIFPTPGYQFSKSEMVVSDSVPTTLIASFMVEAPGGFVAEVETPFSQYLGTFTLGEGKYPVAADVNGDAIYRSSIKVSETPPNSEWITFKRSGGFAGWTQNLYIGMDRSAAITSDTEIDANNRSGLVPQDSFDRLNELMAQIDFSVLDSYYSREVPIADGYMYEITVNRDHTILFEQDAQAPTAVSDLVFILESILDGRIDLLRTFDSESSVSNWSMY